MLRWWECPINSIIASNCQRTLTQETHTQNILRQTTHLWPWHSQTNKNNSLPIVFSTREYNGCGNHTARWTVGVMVMRNKNAQYCSVSWEAHYNTVIEICCSHIWPQAFDSQPPFDERTRIVEDAVLMLMFHVADTRRRCRRPPELRLLPLLCT